MPRQSHVVDAGVSRAKHTVKICLVQTLLLRKEQKGSAKKSEGCCSRLAELVETKSVYTKAQALSYQRGYSWQVAIFTHLLTLQLSARIYSRADAVDIDQKGVLAGACMTEMSLDESVDGKSEKGEKVAFFVGSSIVYRTKRHCPRVPG